MASPASFGACFVFRQDGAQELEPLTVEVGAAVLSFSLSRGSLAEIGRTIRDSISASS
jgi:hypothetical protein